MLSNHITVCIFAYNEESRILRCIRNFQQRLPILVIDNFSTDNTYRVVQDYGFRVVSIRNPGFIETPSVMDEVISCVPTDYLLIVSVSEYVPILLLSKYAEIANKNSHDVVFAYRKSITAGLEIPITGPPSGMHRQLRFFKRGSVSYDNNKVHGIGRPLVNPSRILNLSGDASYSFYQFRDYDCSKTELTMCRYNNILARQMFDAGISWSIMKALLSAAKVFLVFYVKNGCLRYGLPGFVQSYYFAHNELTVWLRLWEYQSGYTLPEVIELNNKIRSSLESEL